MKLNDWFCITDGRVTEGSEFGFDCYGDRAYTLTYWNGLHRDDEVSSHVVYDRATFEVYEAEAFDGAREVTYVWRKHEHRAAYDAELTARVGRSHMHDWEEILLETEEDFIDKATAIINGEEYDTRVSVPVDLDDETLYKFMMEAHRRDMTFNQLVEEALRLAISKESPRPEEGTDDEQKSIDHLPEFIKEAIRKESVTWVNGVTEDFIGLWNTVKALRVIDCDYGQFCGGVVSCKYETAVYIYTAVWYNGDTEQIPDEITREKKTV